MRVLIVDDEAAARRRLATLLEELDVEVVGEADNGMAALDLARAHRPDVVLLDIAMPEVDGFDVARHLPEPRPLVIFQTAYDEHALQAFEHEAVDYVVKPVTQKRLEEALKRAHRRLEATARPALETEMVTRLASGLADLRGVRRHRILVRHGASHRLVSLRDITKFVADEGLVRAHVGTKHYVTDYTLNEIEERARSRFVRTSRAELVNADRIEQIASNGDGSATLTLSDGTTVRVSRRRAAAVKEALEG